jgi:hypothetical protein
MQTQTKGKKPEQVLRKDNNFFRREIINPCSP